MNFNSLSKKEIEQVSMQFYNLLINNLDKNQFKVYKPMPSPIDKIQNKIRYRIIIKGNMNKTANETLNNILNNLYQKDLKTTRITIDVNPNNMI